MTLARAREILEAAKIDLDLCVQGPSPGSLYFQDGFFDGAPYVFYRVGEPASDICGHFTADQFEALAVWMRAHAKEGP